MILSENHIYSVYVDVYVYSLKSGRAHISLQEQYISDLAARSTPHFLACLNEPFKVKRSSLEADETSIYEKKKPYERKEWHRTPFFAAQCIEVLDLD